MLCRQVKLESQKEEITLANRLYEMMYIATPETVEEDIVKLNESITALVEKGGGSVEEVEEWGRRRLAYPIRKKTEGIYVLLEITGSGQEIAELERRFRVNDVILRYMTVRVDEDRKAAEKKRVKREKKKNRGGHVTESAEEAQD